MHHQKFTSNITENTLDCHLYLGRRTGWFFSQIKVHNGRGGCVGMATWEVGLFYCEIGLSLASSEMAISWGCFRFRTWRKVLLEKKLWRFSVQPKVRNYWWRVIKKFVPARAILRDRHIERIGFCEACGREETIYHALFECTWAK